MFVSSLCATYVPPHIGEPTSVFRIVVFFFFFNLDRFPIFTLVARFSSITIDYNWISIIMLNSDVCGLLKTPFLACEVPFSGFSVFCRVYFFKETNRFDRNLCRLWMTQQQKKLKCRLSCHLEMTEISRLCMTHTRKSAIAGECVRIFLRNIIHVIAVCSVFLIKPGKTSGTKEQQSSTKNLGEALPFFLFRLASRGGFFPVGRENNFSKEKL